ncbi:hypothetical protein [Mycoplasmopsis columboralis]|uniref:Uncharacterized protein n=1 Tax=Mycoplasmopsis columboralis TaxID=171282 RepID=A0A449B5S5_9BACT|nr:hypothetical protein [Mycoplasmopsis columboralis]VEU75964.1 Uncharacterised protein [Mycoplasmopsis columboralis]
MILAYADPKITPQPIKPKQGGTFAKVIFKTLAGVFFDFVGEILADTLTAFFPVLLPVNRLIKIGATVVGQAVSDLIFNNKVDPTNLLWSAGTAILSFGIAQGVRQLKKIKYTKKLVENTEKLKKGLEFYKKGITDKIAEISKYSLEQLAKTKKVKNTVLIALLNPQNVERVKKAFELSALLVKNPLALFTRAITFVAQKSKSHIMAQVAKLQQRALTKGLAKAIARGKLTPKQANRYIRFFRTKQKRWIPLISDWLRGVRLYHEELYDQTKNVTFMLYFDFAATGGHGKIKGKTPLELILPWSDFWAFINDPSPGRYYLDNIAWGEPWKRTIGENSTIVLKNLNQDLQNDLIKRYRLAKPDSYEQAINNLESYKNEVYKHRTNKRQLFATLYKNQGTAYIRFSREYQSGANRFTTKISRRIK